MYDPTGTSLYFYRPITDGVDTEPQLKTTLMFVLGLSATVALMAGVGSILAMTPLSQWYFGLTYFTVCAIVCAAYAGVSKAWHAIRGTTMDTMDWIPVYGLMTVGGIVGLMTTGFSLLIGLKEAMGLGGAAFMATMVGVVIAGYALIEFVGYVKDRYQQRHAPLSDDELTQSLLSNDSPSIAMQRLESRTPTPTPDYRDDEDSENEFNLTFSPNASSSPSFKG